MPLSTSAPQIFPGYGIGVPNIQATLFRKNEQSNDLVPYLKAIHTEKDMTQPAGIFSISLAYTPDTSLDYSLSGARSNLYTVRSLLSESIGAQPFDIVNIQIQDSVDSSRQSHYMRGFIDDIDFDQESGGGNDMSRTIHLSGRDYGSLMQNFQVNYLQPGMANFTGPTGAGGMTLFYALASAWHYTGGQLKNSTGARAHDLFPILGKYNVGTNIISTSDFVNFIMTETVNHNHIRNIKLRYNSAINYIYSRCLVPPWLGTWARDSNLMSFQGSLDDLIRQVQSPPWAEYFIRDEKDGPVMYYRIAPYVNLDGTYQWSESGLNYGDINFIEIPRSDVIDIKITKSQGEVYTAFFTLPHNFMFPDNWSPELIGLTKWSGLGNPYNDALNSKDPNRVERYEKFGFRYYQATTPWVFGEFDHRSKAYQKDAPNLTTVPKSMDKANQLNNWLVKTMGNMEKLYSGTITCRGIHGARIGDYVYYQDDQDVPGLYFYVQGVAVDWEEGRPITETLSVIRGQPNNFQDTGYRSGQVYGQTAFSRSRK